MQGGVFEKLEIEAKQSESEETQSSLGVFDGRWDRTDELLKDKYGNLWKRRLDSIARLLEGSSTGAAITLIDNTFLIASDNEFPPDEKTTNQDYLLIGTVMSFFKIIAEGKFDLNSYAEAFRTICIQAAEQLQLSDKVSKQLQDKDFIQRVINSEINPDSRRLKQELNEQVKRNQLKPTIKDIFVFCQGLKTDFDEVRKFIYKIRSKQNGPEVRFLQALKSYSDEVIIDDGKLRGKVSAVKNMHAEMKILSFIKVRLEKREKFATYIGISKLCCFDCHCIIYGINQASEYENTIEIRGAHNEKVTNWSPPFNITGTPPNLSPAAIQEPTQENSIEDLFAKMVSGSSEAALRLPSWVNTSRPRRGSPAGSGFLGRSSLVSQNNTDDLFEDYYQNIKMLVANLMCLGLTDTFQYENLLIVEKLCENSLQYRDFWRLNYFTEIEPKTVDETISELAKDSNIFSHSKPKDNETTLRELFKNKVYVGEHIAQYFSKDGETNIVQSNSLITPMYELNQNRNPLERSDQTANEPTHQVSSVNKRRKLGGSSDSE